MPDTTAEDVLEGIERVIVAADFGWLTPPAPSYRGPDEGAHVSRDADGLFTVLPVSDVRTDKRSGGSCYRMLTVQIGMQFIRRKDSRRKMLAAALVLEDALRHLKANIEALAVPVTGVKWARIMSGPTFDHAVTVDGSKALLVTILEVEYHTATS